MFFEDYYVILSMEDLQNCIYALPTHLFGLYLESQLIIVVAVSRNDFVRFLLLKTLIFVTRLRQLKFSFKLQ